jgi:hypothetical protein
MPWKGCRKMDEKLKFVSRFLVGKKIAALCREFGISRVAAATSTDIGIAIAARRAGRTCRMRSAATTTSGSQGPMTSD